MREISEDTTQNVAEVRKQKTNQVEENHKNVREVVKSGLFTSPLTVRVL